MSAAGPAAAIAALFGAVVYAASAAPLGAAVAVSAAKGAVGASVVAAELPLPAFASLGASA